MTSKHTPTYCIWTFLPKLSSSVVWATRKYVARSRQPPIYASGSGRRCDSCAIFATVIVFCSRSYRRRQWKESQNFHATFGVITRGLNLSRAESRLDEVLKEADNLETVPVMDADRTLATEDTGALFWKMFFNSRSEAEPLRKLFQHGGLFVYFLSSSRVYIRGDSWRRRL
jgi:hypothetical protein